MQGKLGLTSLAQLSLHYFLEPCAPDEHKVSIYSDSLASSDNSQPVAVFPW